MLERANIVGDLAPPPEASDKASLHFVHGRGLNRKLTQKLFAETLGAMNTGHSTHAWFEGEGTGDSHSIFFFFFFYAVLVFAHSFPVSKRIVHHFLKD